MLVTFAIILPGARLCHSRGTQLGAIKLSVITRLIKILFLTGDSHSLSIQIHLPSFAVTDAEKLRSEFVWMEKTFLQIFTLRSWWYCLTLLHTRKKSPGQEMIVCFFNFSCCSVSRVGNIEDVIQPFPSALSERLSTILDPVGWKEKKRKTRKKKKNWTERKWRKGSRGEV